jgi:hypothetical protein
MFVDAITSRIGAGVGDAVADRFRAAMSDADAAVRAQGLAAMSIEAMEHEAMELAGQVRVAEDLEKSRLPFWSGVLAGALTAAGVVCSIARDRD